MLHVGDTIETLITGRWYKVAAIYAHHAVADGLHDPNDQIDIPLTNGSQEIVHTTQFAKVVCGHEGTKSGSTDYQAALLEAYARNYGAADSALVSLARILIQLKPLIPTDGAVRIWTQVDRMHDSITSYLETVVDVPSVIGPAKTPHVIGFPQEFQRDARTTHTTGDPE